MADAIGYGNVDFRCFGAFDGGSDRIGVVRGANGLPPFPLGGPLREHFRSAGRPGALPEQARTVEHRIAGR